MRRELNRLFVILVLGVLPCATISACEDDPNDFDFQKAGAGGGSGTGGAGGTGGTAGKAAGSGGSSSTAGTGGHANDADAG